MNGLVLGDGHIHFPTPDRPGYLQVRMTNRRFVEWLDDQFGWLSTGARLYREETARRRTAYSVRTRSHGWFERYREWYEDGQTVVPTGYSLSPLAARIWYVSDGSISWGAKPSLRLYCSDYVDSTPDRIPELFDEHGFAPSVEPYGLRFPVADHEVFLNWIGPAPPGFSYKWETDSKERYRRLRS
ncbi:MAG: hypothetical protein ABEJ05_04335 [Haloglomus sp.]